MSCAGQMLETDLRTLNVDDGLLAETIDALHDCAQACTADIDADLSELDAAEMVECIRLCLDCADVCSATAGVTGRRTWNKAAVTKPLLESCAAICKSCGEECERHAKMHAHCGVCAEACRHCERSCRQLLQALS